MKIRIESKALHGILKSVAQVIDKGPSLPALRCVLIEADQHVRVQATNLEQHYALDSLDPDDSLVSSKGALLLPAKKLTEIVSLQDGPIEISSTASKPQVASIKSDQAEYELHSLSPDEYPPHTADKTKTYKLPAGPFKAALRRVAPAMSTDATRYVLCGVYFQAHKNKILFAATDGRRLCVDSLPYEPGAHQFGNCIVPAKAVHVLTKHLPTDTEDAVVIQVGNKSAIFTWTGHQLHTRLVEGNYPNYEQALPDNSADVKVKMDADVLKCVLCKAAAMCSDNPAVKLQIADGGLAASTNVPDYGTASVHTKDITAQPGPVAVDFNPSYMIELLANLTGDLEFHFRDELSPLVLKQKRFTAVLMPLRMG